MWPRAILFYPNALVLKVLPGYLGSKTTYRQYVEVMSNLGKWIVEIALIVLLVGHLGLIPTKLHGK